MWSLRWRSLVIGSRTRVKSPPPPPQPPTPEPQQPPISIRSLAHLRLPAKQGSSVFRTKRSRVHPQLSQMEVFTIKGLMCIGFVCNSVPFSRDMSEYGPRSPVIFLPPSSGNEQSREHAPLLLFFKTIRSSRYPQLSESALITLPHILSSLEP